MAARSNATPSPTGARGETDAAPAREGLRVLLEEAAVSVDGRGGRDVTPHLEKLESEWVTDVETLRACLRNDNDLTGVLPLMLRKALRQRLRRRPDGDDDGRGGRPPGAMLRPKNREANGRATLPPFDAEDKENRSSRSKQLERARNIDDGVGRQLSGDNGPKVKGAAPSMKKRGVDAVGDLLEKLKVVKPVDKERDVLFECKATAFRFSSIGADEEDVAGASMHWTKSGAGTLKVCRHRETGRSSLEHRKNKIVKLNVAIGNNGMCGVEKLKFPMKRKKPAGRVDVDVLRFFALVDERKDSKRKGPEWFMIKAKTDKLDALYDALKELGAEVKTGTEA